MFDVDNVALDRMAEAQWNRLLNHNIVIEMPADPAANPIALDAVSAVAKGGADPAPEATGISKETYKDNLSRLRAEVAREIEKKKGYRIEFLDRTAKAESEIGRIFKDSMKTKKDRVAAKKVGKAIDDNPLAYAVQTPERNGGTVCMTLFLKPGTSFKKAMEENAGATVAWGNVTEEALHKWAADHELGHCLNAAGKNVHKSVHLAVSEELADTFAALKAIRDGSPSDTVRLMAAFREHDQWLGDTSSPYFSAKILWKIAEMQETLSKSEKFRSLDLAGLAGLARDVHAQFGMTKADMIFVRDVRQVMGELRNTLGDGPDVLKVDGGSGQVSFKEWLGKHADKVPELNRIRKVVETLENGPADLGMHRIDEKGSMAAIHALAASGDSGGKAMRKVLTDRKVAPLTEASLMDANLGRPTKLSSILPLEEPIEAASVGIPTDHESKVSLPLDAAGTTDITPTDQIPASEQVALQGGDSLDATSVAPEATQESKSADAADRDLSRNALAGAADVERTVREVIAELTRTEFAKAEAAKAATALYASRIAMASASKERTADLEGIELPPAPGKFDDAPRSPRMMDMQASLPSSTRGMPRFASLDKVSGWEKNAWLTSSAPSFNEAWARPQTKAAALHTGNDPHFRGTGFINENDVSRLLDMARPLEFGGFNAQRAFVKDIVNAARDTKVDPVTLLAMCAQESGLGNRNEAKTSTGRGPFQFLEQTWLYMVKNHGHRYNMGEEAAKISVGKDGRMEVDDPVAKQQILKLRYNTYLSAAIAGEMLQLSREGIEKAIKRPMSTEEMYLSHVMGEGGARKLLLLADGKKKNERADRYFRKAAQANEGLFYKKEGGRRKPVSNAELADRMTDKISKLREHFADAIKVIDSGFQTADVKMPDVALAENVIPERQEQSQPTYLFSW